MRVNNSAGVEQTVYDVKMIDSRWPRWISEAEKLSQIESLKLRVTGQNGEQELNVWWRVWSVDNKYEVSRIITLENDPEVIPIFDVKKRSW